MSLKEKEARIVELEHALTQLSDEDVYQKEAIVKQIEEIKKEAYENLDAWDIVYLARHPKRPKASDYIEALFPDFIELHGDRAFGDDGACQGGLASFHGIGVTVLAQSKGKTLEENMKRNFGMLNPEGYRKALRLAKEAERFHRPIITLVDTSGAYPGKGAEERGQAEAIAQCLEVFSNLKTPVIAVVLSEGGSGGALAFSVADKIFMLENAVYSILSPEGFASILWKDGSRAAEAAAVMELTAADLKRKGIIDEIIHEPVGGAHVCLEYVIEQMDELLWTTLQDLNKKKDKTLLSERYEKFRKMGTSYEIL
ncbi:acetyl-CoA carboxylase carboxyltransferase subunit alpha [Amedibacillus sp. YH-ame6]